MAGPGPAAALRRKELFGEERRRFSPECQNLSGFVIYSQLMVVVSIHIGKSPVSKIFGLDCINFRHNFRERLNLPISSSLI